jgi:hypothetical protein
MHRGDPAGQIAPDRAGDAGCTSCHASTKEHSHHPVGSPGAFCVACHMPRTSFALLSAVRSHRIDSPRVLPLPEKPNACSLCHLDRTPAWAARTLHEWFPTSSGRSGRDDVSAGLLYGLSADAGVRALVADALGDPRLPAGQSFRVAILREMTRDPYAAVRLIAERSLGTAPADVRPLDPDVVRQRLAERDDRAITIAE